MNRPVASGIFLLLVGTWLLLQTLVGDLPGRIISWGKAAEAGRVGGSPRPRSAGPS